MKDEMKAKLAPASGCRALSRYIVTTRRVSHLIAATLLVTLLSSHPLSAGNRSKDTDTAREKVTLNRHQVASVAVVLAEMRRRGERFRGWQMVVTDKGSSYEVAFMEDPLDMTTTGGDGMSWVVRKRDLRLLGPTYYR
jgi:hypothetical protein